MKPFVEAGITMDTRPLGNAPNAAYLGTDGATVAVFNQRPHPNAARVFVNWIMSKRIAVGLSQAQVYDSRRSDVAPIDPTQARIPGAKYVQAQKDENDELLRKLQAELKKRRPQ
jgi:ABC-type Fe3+ transport system substrate-binding protein